jgi:hypothetical protein
LPDIDQRGPSPQVQRTPQQLGDGLRISRLRRLAPGPREAAELLDVGMAFKLVPRVPRAEELASDTLARGIHRQAAAKMEDVGLKRRSRTSRRVVTPQLLDDGGNCDDPPGIQGEQRQNLALLGCVRRDGAGPQGCGQRA